MITERELPRELLAGLRWLEEQYLLGANPRAQSGTSSDERRWRSKREFILEAIDTDGDLLDVGCANGYLLQSLMAWGAERGLTLIPYGADHGPRLIELAKERLPQYASHLRRQRLGVAAGPPAQVRL
jgi:hypothetical protein